MPAGAGLSRHVGIGIYFLAWIIFAWKYGERKLRSSDGVASVTIAVSLLQATAV
jgi:hypothetical protein